MILLNISLLLFFVLIIECLPSGLEDFSEFNVFITTSSPTTPSLEVDLQDQFSGDDTNKEEGSGDEKLSKEDCSPTYKSLQGVEDLMEKFIVTYNKLSHVLAPSPETNQPRADVSGNCRITNNENCLIESMKREISNLCEDKLNRKLKTFKIELLKEIMEALGNNADKGDDGDSFITDENDEETSGEGEYITQTDPTESSEPKMMMCKTCCEEVPLSQFLNFNTDYDEYSSGEYNERDSTPTQPSPNDATTLELTQINNTPTARTKYELPRDCADLFKRGVVNDGVYRIQPTQGKIWKVFCDMSTNGGGWTVIQRRVNGAENFTRTWGEYRKGFGRPEVDHWIGLNKMNILTTQRNRKMVLQIDLLDWENERRFARYNKFRIGGRRTNYTMHVDDFIGDAGDAIRWGNRFNTNNQQFTTIDVDNDNYEEGNCGEYYAAGWWFNSCFSANLNGQYYRGTYRGSRDGIYWGTWYQLTDRIDRATHYSFKYVDMKIRPKKFNKN